MDCSKLEAVLKKKLSEKRYMHSLGVSKMAKKLAEQFGVSIEKATLAGLMHDCARTYKDDKLVQIARELNITIGPIEQKSPILLHAAIGAELISHEYGIFDQEIKQAILLHTTGGKHMTKLDKIIYLADMIEPTRDYPGVEKLRTLAKENLDEATFAAMNHSICHVVACNQVIHPDTIIARNEFLLKE